MLSLTSPRKFAALLNVPKKIKEFTDLSKAKIKKIEKNSMQTTKDTQRD